MTLQIGRVGIDVSLVDGMGLSVSGDRFDLSGHLYASSLSDAKVLRQQLLGYVNNPDEPFVPVVSSVDSTLDGYYRVLDVRVDADPSLSVGNRFPYSVSLERLHGYALPRFESLLIGTVITNDHSFTTANDEPWHGLSSTVIARAAGNAEYVARGGDGVTVEIHPCAYGDTVSWAAEPGDWYKGAATVEVGSTLRAVVGEQIEHLPEDWRLSNGLVQVIPNATNPGQFDVSHYDTNAFVTKTYALTYEAVDAAAHSTLSSAWDSVAVLRNGPAECSIRLTKSVGISIAASVSSMVIQLDLSLRRGDFTVRGYAQIFSSGGRSLYARDLGIKRASTEAATSITGGIRATSNDASGNRYVLMCARTTTADTTNGGLVRAGGGVMDFGISLELDGSSAATGNTATDLVEQYHSLIAETVLAASR